MNESTSLPLEGAHPPPPSFPAPSPNSVASPPASAPESTAAAVGFPDLPWPGSESVLPPTTVAAGASAAAPAADASTLREDTQAIRTQLDQLLRAFPAFERRLEELTQRIGFLPPQVRSLGGKIDGLATAISEARYRGLLLGVLGIHDLVDQLLRTAAPPAALPPAVDHLRNYDVLRVQLRQLLEANGLSEIPTDGSFNPESQRALDTVPCDDPARDGQVCKVVRPGFRTASAVLRYAEVLVWQYRPGRAGTDGQATQAGVARESSGPAAAMIDSTPSEDRGGSASENKPTI